MEKLKELSDAQVNEAKDLGIAMTKLVMGQDNLHVAWLAMAAAAASLVTYTYIFTWDDFDDIDAAIAKFSQCVRTEVHFYDEVGDDD